MFLVQKALLVNRFQHFEYFLVIVVFTIRFSIQNVIYIDNQLVMKKSTNWVQICQNARFLTHIRLL